MISFLSGAALFGSNGGESSCLNTKPLVKLFLRLLYCYRCRSQLSLRHVFSLVGRFVHRCRLIPTMLTQSARGVLSSYFVCLQEYFTKLIQSTYMGNIL